MKIITLRKGPPHSLKDAEILLRTINRLRKGGIVPRGVYRFSSNKKADQWMIQKMASTHVLQSSKT